MQKVVAAARSRLFLVCCVKLCSFDSCSWSVSYLSIYLPLVPPSASGTEQDGRARPVWLALGLPCAYVGGGALQHGRFGLFFPSPPRLAAIIPRDGMAREGNRSKDGNCVAFGIGSQ